MPERARLTIARQLLNITSEAGGYELEALLPEVAARIVAADLRIDSTGNWHIDQQWVIENSVAIGRGAVSSDVRLHVGLNSTTTATKTIQADRTFESGTGGVGTAVQANASRITAGSSTGGQLFGLGAEALCRQSGTGQNFGANIAAKLMAGATGGGEITAAEFDCVSEEAPSFRTGCFVAAVPSSELPTTEGIQATGIDAMFAGGNKTYGAKWKDGVLFYNVSGTRFPIDTTGSILRVQLADANTITNGIDFSDSNLTVTGHSLKLRNVRVTGAGIFQIVDGITAPSTVAGWAQIYVDTADGDLKVIFGDGTVKTIVTDT